MFFTEPFAQVNQFAALGAKRAIGSGEPISAPSAGRALDFVQLLQTELSYHDQQAYSRPDVLTCEMAWFQIGQQSPPESNLPAPKVLARGVGVIH